MFHVSRDASWDRERSCTYREDGWWMIVGETAVVIVTVLFADSDLFGQVVSN